jgi:hypothetical protein
MLTGTCCDPAIQAAISDVQGGTYSGSPRLQQRLIGDYQNRANWAYDPVSNACTWTAPPGAFYTLDGGDPAGVATPQSVDSAHYGGGCVKGGAPTPAPVPGVAPPVSFAPILLLAGVGAAVLWYLWK